MNICLVTLDFIPYRSSGLAVYGENLALGLAEKGHRITVVASQRESTQDHEYQKGIEVHRLPIGSTDWIGYALRAAGLLRRLEGQQHFDIVHFLDVHFAFAYGGHFIATMFQSFRQRLVSGGRLPYYSTPVNFLTRLAYYNLARRWMEPVSLGRATRLIASSRATRDEFITHYRVPPGKIETIPLGIDVDRFKPQRVDELRHSLGLEDSSLLLFVGFATARKGLEYLAEALLLLDPGVRLLFIGRWEPGYRERFYRVLGDAADRVTELGYVPDPDLPAYFSLADLFVLPSLLEGFGLPIVEAMSSGTPVVATQAGSIPDVVGDAGYLVPPRDPHALADAIKQLLENSDLRMELARLGRDRARAEFSLNKMVARTEACYKQHTPGLRS